MEKSGKKASKSNIQYYGIDRESKMRGAIPKELEIMPRGRKRHEEVNGRDQDSDKLG